MKKFREVADSDGDAVAAADPSSLRNRRCIPIDLAASLVNLNLDPKAIIKIEDLPPGSLLTCGQGNSNNTWSLKLAETEDVVFIAPIRRQFRQLPDLRPHPDAGSGWIRLRQHHTQVRYPADGHQLPIGLHGDPGR